MSLMIKPTVGRVVWFFDENFKEGDQPRAAIVTFVHSDTEVSLATFTPEGHAGAHQHIRLVGDSETVVVGEAHASWMPYQIGQAKRHEDGVSEKRLEALGKRIEELGRKLALREPVSPNPVQSLDAMDQQEQVAVARNEDALKSGKNK